MSRQERVREAIKKEVSIIIHQELKDPRLGFVTVTDVELSKDLRFARIFFSVLGTEEEHAKTKAALDSGLGFIRKLIAQRLKLQFAPEIVFKEDRSAEYGSKIEEVLNEIKELDKPKSFSAQGKEKDRKEGHSEPKKNSRVHKKT